VLRRSSRVEFEISHYTCVPADAWAGLPGIDFNWRRLTALLHESNLTDLVRRERTEVHRDPRISTQVEITGYDLTLNRCCAPRRALQIEFLVLRGRGGHDCFRIGDVDGSLERHASSAAERVRSIRGRTDVSRRTTVLEKKDALVTHVVRSGTRR
jgi:hypothetical protein